MIKNTKIIIVVAVLLVLAGSGFYAYKKYANKAKAPVPLTTRQMKDSIVSDPKINAKNLTQAQIDQYLQEFQGAKKQVIDTNFDFLQALNAVGYVKEHLGDLDGAIVAYEYANIIRPKNSLSFGNLGALYQYDLKDFPKAEENYLIAVQNDPKYLTNIQNLYRLYFYDMKNNTKAEALVLQTVKDNPTVVDAYTLAGSFYEDTGNKTKAIFYYQQALKIDPNRQSIKDAIARLQKS